MAWVRGHYRRPRGFGRGSKAGNEVAGALILALLVVGGIGAAAIAILGAVLGAIGLAVAFVRGHWLAILVFVVLALSVVIGIFLWRRTARGRLEALIGAARELVAQWQVDAENVARVISLRQAVQPLPSSLVAEFEAHYREAVSRSVADRNVTAKERERLDRVREAFDVSPEVAQRAEIEGFLDVYTRVVADGKLTHDEEAQLAQVRIALRIPDQVVAEQVRFAEWLGSERVRMEAELRRADEIRSSPLAPIETSVQLKKGERCYYAAEFTEKKERVTRSYVSDGVRYKDTALENVRSGQLYVTSERLLLVAGGTTTIKLERVLDHGVDSESHLLGVTVDGRQTPFTFELGEPFVAAAFIDRIAADRE